MPNSNNKIKTLVVGNAKVGKTKLLNCLTSKQEFNDEYITTIGAGFYVLQREPASFEIWDLGGDERFESLRKYYYNSASIIIFALDSTQDANDNKEIVQKFQEYISTNYVGNCFQIIVFTKSDDNNSKISQDPNLNQDYLEKFNNLSIPIIVSSAKENKGFTEINRTLSECSSQLLTNRTQLKSKFWVSIEESLVSAIEDYSKRLSKKDSELAKNKSTALEAIATACRDVGMGQPLGQSNAGYLSERQIFEIQAVIEQNQATVSRHRHSPCLNWFFNLFNPSRLEKRVTSNELVNKLDSYLKGIR